ncbi:MAG: isoprenylcysteine carboxylmethyltransferase family protein [Xanthomonadaceae bacterium]|nr:isoprenylcysteine carboxylmethyltransferase family protein [Xanthomonadaceae bacterium]
MDMSLHVTTATGLVLVALASCLLSFNWGMYRFFTIPHGSNSGIDTIKLVGTCFGIGSLVVLVMLGAESIIQCLLALLLAAASLALFWWAIHSNRRQPLSFAFSDDLPEHLVCVGPYRYIRHPFYAAYLISWLITPVATGEPLMTVPLLVMAVIYTVAARLEERKFAASRLAAAYARYRQATGMFWPCLPGHRLPPGSLA